MDAFESWNNEVNKSINIRKNPVKINWYTLNNSQVLKLYEECKGELNYSAENLENWKDMFRVINGKLKECYYIADIIRLLFENTDKFESSLFANTRNANENLLKMRNWMDSEADTIIFVPVGNDGHAVFAKLLEAVADKNYEIHVLDGNNTTNAECEENSVIDSENARKNNKKCIFISSTMGNRSWSNPYVKNCILLIDNPSYDSTYQKFARTLTPWTDNNGKVHDTACIFDFRLQYSPITPAEKYIADILKQKNIYSDKNVNEVLEKIESSDKIAFFDAYKNIENPLHRLSKEEIRKMISTPDFVTYRFGQIMDNWNISVPEKKITVKSNKNESDNIKGDGLKTIRAKRGVKDRKDDESNEPEENRLRIIEYIKFILNNPKLFRMDGIDENPIEYICNNIDKRKDLIENVYGMSFDTVKDIFEMMNKNKSMFNEDMFSYNF